MAQLRSVINRTNLPADPKQNINAAEDFIRVSVVYVQNMHSMMCIIHPLLLYTCIGHNQRSCRCCCPGIFLYGLH